jgi:phage head maturation protease
MTDFEIRNVPMPLTASGGRIGGYAAVFKAKSHPMVGTRGLFIETLADTAFNKSKSHGWPGVRCRLEHRDEPEYLLGTTDSGNLKLDVDSHGLGYAVDLIPSHRYLAEQVERRIIPGSSFAFDKPDDEWILHEGRMLSRIIHSCRLLDTAPVCQGAYPQADCGLRALESFAKFVGAEVEEVRARAEELGDLRGFLTTTKPKPGYREPLGMEKRVEEIRKSGLPKRLTALMDETEEAEEPKPVAARTAWGRQALIKTLEAKPNGPERLLEALAAQQFTGAERLAQTSVKGQLAALKAELAETRADIARLSDPAAIEREAAQRQTDLAEARAQDELDRLNGSLSPAAALRILEEARPAGCAPYVPLADTEAGKDGGLGSRGQEKKVLADLREPKPEPEPAPAPQYRTMTGWEALRRLEAMRPPTLADLVETPVNRGRASDAYLSESGNRF